ncbi:MAG: PD-(D/E)XK nuclease family protein, partial [Tannerella sp.]|nr:PD-(D/E)XK nuclease family protein [Tannerella sp.]
RTAIVLPDEQLLIPVLHSIPEEITQINVTLGYPLSGAPIASLMESIFEIQQKVRRRDEKTLFYHREVLAILNHPYISSACPDEIAALTGEITAHNKIFISAAELDRSPLLRLIFQQATDEGIADYLIDILKELNKLITSQQGGEEKDENDAAAMGELEQEFVYHYFTTVNRLGEMIRAGGISMSVDTFCRLLKRLTATLSIPFYGKPLSGIQVMGVLETRVLNFDHVIILSMNEGIFPAKTMAGSFIPYNLRRGFGLPVYEHQDSIWSYHFYRLIAGAKKVSLLYDTRTEGLQTGEVSRFVLQLKYQYGVEMKEKFVVPDISSSQPLAISVEKTPEIMSKMEAFRQGGDKALSASTINMYLDCPLKFYFAVIEGLKDEEDEVSERVENNVFGSIFHRVMEWLYQPFCGAMVTADLLKLRAKEQTLTEAIRLAFAELFFHSKEVRPLSGQHYLTGEMIRKYVLKLLEKDSELTPFRYIRSEMKIQHPFLLSNGKAIRLKGFIDRVDEVDGRIRLIDYKTGSRKAMDFKEMENLFDMHDDKRQPAIMQTFMYACMYSLQDASKPVQPALYYARDFFSNSFDPTIYKGKEKASVHDFAEIREEFETHLRGCLDRIFDPDVPFTQTANLKTCSYCSFAGVCGK